MDPLQQLTEAARASVTADWRADQMLCQAVEAAASMEGAQLRAALAGASAAQIRQATCQRVVIDTRTGAVEVLAVVDLPLHHRILWPSLEHAQDALAGMIPDGMDLDVAADRIAAHCTGEGTWGGVWLDCTEQQLRDDLTRHYTPATEVLPRAC